MPMQQPDPQKKNGDSLALIHFVASVFATCLTVFLRTGFGSEALGLHGLSAAVLLCLCMGASPDFRFFFLVWLFALVVQRAKTFRLGKEGVVIHSKYTGYPIVAMKCPFVRSETTAACLIEPAMCFLVATLLVAPLSQPVASFIIMGAISLMVREGIERQVDRKRLQRMHDARIEQEWYADRFRNRVRDM